MSTITKQVLILVKQQGLDQANTAIKGLATTSQAATKSTDALGSSWSKSQTGAVKLSSGVTKLDQSEGKAVKTTDTFAKSTDKAGKSTSGLAAKFQGNKGLIFATVGIATAGIEAIGMFQQYQNATAKVSEAQDRLNQLQRAGITSGKDFEAAQRDVTDANRGAQFALRILTLSIGDLIPFTLLLINSGVKLKDTLGGVKGAVDTASAGAKALGGATQAAASGGLTQMFNSAGQVVGGMKGLDTSVRTAVTSSDELFNSSGQLVTQFGNVGRTVQDNTKFIGTRSSGLVGGVSALTLGMNDSNKMSTKFKDAFRQIGDHIKSLPATFTKIGSSVKGFFTNFGTNLGKLPGLFKAAGTAVMGFGKAMLAAVVSNPILLVIAAIATAVIALIGNFGGFRDAVNSVGVAIGNAIPQLKGVLTWFGEMANGALDAVAGFLGFETSAKKSGAAAAEAKLEMDPLLVSMQKFIDLGPQFNNLDNIVTVFANVRTEVTKVSDQFDVFRGKSVTNLQAVGNAFTTAMATFKDKSPQAQVAIQHVYDTIKLLETGHYDAATSQKFLTAAIDAAFNALGNQVKETEKDVAAKQKQDQATTKLQGSTTKLSEGALKVAVAMNKAQASEEGVKEATDKNAEAVQNLITKYGGVIPPIDELSTAQTKLLNLLYDVAPLLEDYEGNLQIVNNSSIDWQKTILSLTAEHQKFTDQSTSDWEAIKALLDQGVVGYKNAISYVELLSAVDKERGALAKKNLEEEIEKREQNSQSLSDMIDKAQEGAKKTEEAETKTQDSLEKSRQKIQEKATELKILDKIQGLSTQNQENAIKITEEQNKTDNNLILGLQKLATARGLDISMIGKTSTELVNYIATHKKAGATIDEINAKTGELVAARQDEARAADLETAAQNKLLQIMNKVPPVLGMTGKGLDSLVKLYDETANATKIAADEVGTWWAELEKSQKVDEETVTKLEELAKGLGVTIPDSIKQKGIPAIKDYIEEVTGIGPAAKKATDEARKAFDDLHNKAKSALEGIISDSLGEDGDNVKKALKGIEKVGKSITDLDSQQAIIDLFLNDDSFTNDIMSLDEIISKEFNGLQTLSAEQGKAVGDRFVESARDALGEKGSPIADTIDQIWQDVQASAKPGESGEVTIGRFAQALQNANLIQSSAQTGIVNPLQQVFGQGVQISDKYGNDVITSVGGALASGANTIANEAQTGIVDPTTNAVGTIPTGAETALEPVEGVFSDAFLKASIASTGQLNLLFADINTSMGYLVTNIQTKLTSIETLWINHATNIGTQITTLQTVFLNLQTAIAAYMTAMTTSIAAWITSSTTSMGAFIETITLLQTTFTTLQETVAANMTGLTTSIAAWITASIKSMGELIKVVTTTQKTFSTLSTSVATYMKSMTTNISSFAKSAGTSFGTAGKAATTLQKAESDLSKNTATYSKSMASNLKSFSSSAVSSLNAVTSAAKKAESALKSMAAAAAKAKSARSGLRFGGSFVTGASTMNQSSFAQTGKSWINSRPRRIGGVNISEFSKPELVTVTPLSNPSDPMDKGLNYLDKLPGPKLEMPDMSNISGASRNVGGGGGGGQPIELVLHTTIAMPDGKVLAKAVQTHLLSGFSGIT